MLGQDRVQVGNIQTEDIVQVVQVVEMLRYEVRQTVLRLMAGRHLVPKSFFYWIDHTRGRIQQTQSETVETTKQLTQYRYERKRPVPKCASR